MRTFAAADFANRGWVPDLSEEEILAWADAHHARTGEWPIATSGPIPEVPGESWMAVEAALSMGLRGLAEGATLARLLAEYRGKRHPDLLPALSIPEILEWADAYFTRYGNWPTRRAGAIADAPGETWAAVDAALAAGTRGLPSGSRLARLLAEQRGKRHPELLPALSIAGILEWADAYRARRGSWPTSTEGAIADAPGETWGAVDAALAAGSRGLPGATSLARLLAEHRGKRNIRALPMLTVAEVLEWADAHFARTGRWPEADSGQFLDARDDNWRSIENALRIGLRGLPGGSSLAKLLAERRGKRNRKALASYTIEQILAWADAHHERTGKWPNRHSGPVTDAAEETWAAVDAALQHGSRGLPGGTSSLAQLLAERRHVRNPASLPRLTLRQILAWADAHHERTGQWPRNASGAIPGSGGETWSAVGQALDFGMRGLPGGSSLARLLDQRRGTKRSKYHTPLAVDHILAWADAYHGRHGRWPNVSSGAIPEAPHESWNGVSIALRTGSRGLPGRSSLAKLLIERRSARTRYYAPRLTTHLILVWADAHHLQTGRWPSSVSGAVTGGAGETWMSVDLALRQGLRGLPGGSSLAKLLDRHRRKAAASAKSAARKRSRR